MKILTLNTWQERGEWRRRWGVILEGLEKFHPDLAAFQELFNPSWASEIQKRTGFKTMLFRENAGGLAVYSHYPITEWGYQVLTQSPLEEYLRYVLWSRFEVGGRRLFFLNTHLSWKLEDGPSRKKQTEEILTLIQEKASEEERILVGDLNAPRPSPEIGAFIKKGGFRDLFFERHPKDSGFTWDNRNPYVRDASEHLPDRRIDFVLARGEGPLLKEPASCDLVYTNPSKEGIFASDHYGVLAEFKGKAPGLGE